MDDAPDPTQLPAAPTGRQPTGTGTTAAGAGSTPLGAPPLVSWLALYTALRLGTLVVLTVLLSLLMPLILALLFAVLLALPLSWMLFGPVRRRVNEAMAAKSANRRGERDRLRAALDGQDPR